MMTETRGTRFDFFDFLAPDVISKILKCLDDPGDIARASSVSSSWHHFIISNATSKQLCQRLFPQLSSVSRTFNVGNNTGSDGCNSTNDWNVAKMEHEMFFLLAQNLLSLKVGGGGGGCILYAISASSTDRYPDESVSNTLDPRISIGYNRSYWSSSGQKDPDVHEKLTYKLVSDFCVISQIDVQPFQAYFQQGRPIYSARSVQFRMGHRKLQPDAAHSSHVPDSEEMKCGGGGGDGDGDEDKYVWTYTSPEFPMTQKGTPQAFMLPQPALCIGGILQIDLLGRVQRQESDSLFYICVAYVRALGRSLSPLFSSEILEPCTGTFSLIYNPHALCDPRDESSDTERDV